MCWCLTAGCPAGFAAYRERIDCFKSARGAFEGAELAVLAGRVGVEEPEPPKKSRPRRESPGLLCLGGAGSAFGGGGLVTGGGPVLGREGGEVVSSPKISIVGCLLTGGAVDLLLVAAAARCEEERSNLAFSCTTLRG